MIPTFLKLVRWGIGHVDGDVTMPDRVDWKRMLPLAARQGLSAVVLDGVEEWKRMAEESGKGDAAAIATAGEGGANAGRGREESQAFPPAGVLVPWVGEVFQNYERRYGLYQRTLGEMASFYEDHGLKMMVLKGYACSLDWPRPEHRPAGDIDIWLFGEYKRADELLQREKGIAVDTGHHHHTVFYWGDFMVENHYDFLNLQHHRSNAGIEKVLKELGMDDSRSVDLGGSRVYLPAPNLHALFLLRHAMTHFASTDINLRQLLDWAFFVQAHSSEVDWKWLTGMLEEYGMMRLFHLFNAICVEDLGFDAGLFPTYCGTSAGNGRDCETTGMGGKVGQTVEETQASAGNGSNRVVAGAGNAAEEGMAAVVDEALKDRVLRELISPEFAGQTPAKLLPRVLFKYRRWRANRWKHELCFNESLWSAFWTGIWGHLTQPNSI